MHACIHAYMHTYIHTCVNIEASDAPKEMQILRRYNSQFNIPYDYEAVVIRSKNTKDERVVIVKGRSSVL